MDLWPEYVAKNISFLSETFGTPTISEEWKKVKNNEQVLFFTLSIAAEKPEMSLINGNGNNLNIQNVVLKIENWYSEKLELSTQKSKMPTVFCNA